MAGRTKPGPRSAKKSAAKARPATKKSARVVGKKRPASSKAVAATKTAKPGKRAATTRKPPVAPKPKKKKVARKKPAPPPATPRAPVPTPSATSQLPLVPETLPALPSSASLIPTPAPSERLLAARADLPGERPLTAEEREAMTKVSETARRFIEADGGPKEIVRCIAGFVESVRSARLEEPQSQDVRLGLGVLWGEQLCAQAGWAWVHLTYPDGFASYALVPDDRAFACFPLNRVPEALRPSGTNTSAHVFESICAGTLPTRLPNTYLVIG